MKKNLKYFEDELSRLSKEFTEFKKKSTSESRKSEKLLNLLVWNG